MANLISNFRSWVKRTFPEDSFHWTDRSYLVDWIVASIAWFLAWTIKNLPPFEREFTATDPIIAHSHKPNQISGDLTWLLALLVPLFVILIVGTIRGCAHEIHHGFLGLWTARGFNALITESLKNRVGRLRPDFLSRCKWKEAISSCSGQIDKVLDGRRSFPSGHSSTAFCGMTFLSLWLAGVTGAWYFSRAAPARSLLGSRLARISLTLSPLTFATWVAISRIEDNRHHKEDVIVGSIIGIITATIAYLIYWPNPFTRRHTDMGESLTRPRIVYRDDTTGRSRNNYDEYELAATEHATEPV